MDKVERSGEEEKYASYVEERVWRGNMDWGEWREEQVENRR